MLSQAVGYAATALGFVAAAGGRPVLVKDIAEAAGIPAPYLAKIVQTLARRGLVITQRGIGGGVALAQTASSITLYDLCVALDDPCIHQRCMLGTDVCSDERACPAHQFWTSQRAKMLDYLRKMTVADIAAFESRRRWKHSVSRPPSPAHALHGTGSSGSAPMALSILGKAPTRKPGGAK
jgi:Rrf2 family protein